MGRSPLTITVLNIKYIHTSGYNKEEKKVTIIKRNHGINLI